MKHAISNPSNPYVGFMRVFPGTLIKIDGRASYGGSRFAINLQLGPNLSPRDDIALHLSPNFAPVSKVVRNSLLQNKWGYEESDGPFVFGAGQPFEIMILVNDTQFMIAINGSHYCEFKHRIPYQEITHLTLDGDAKFESILVWDVNQQTARVNQQSDAVYVPPGGFQSAINFQGPASSAPSNQASYSPNPINTWGQAYPQAPPMYPTQPLFPDVRVPHQQVYDYQYRAGSQQPASAPPSHPQPSRPF